MFGNALKRSVDRLISSLCYEMSEARFIRENCLCMTDKLDLVGVLLVVYKERREDANALWE